MIAMLRKMQEQNPENCEILGYTIDFLVMFSDKDQLLYFLAIGYYGDMLVDEIMNEVGKAVYKKVTTFVSAKLPLVRDFMIGIEIGEAITKPLVEGSLNTSETLSKAYRVRWAIDAANEYAPVFRGVIKRFRENPIENYSDMLYGSAMMCQLVATEIQALADWHEAINAGWWPSFTNWLQNKDPKLERERVYDVDLWKQYLSFSANYFGSTVLQP